MGRRTKRTAIRLAVGLAVLSGLPGEALAAPPSCDLAVTVSPPPTPTSTRKAQVRIPVGRTDVRFRASSGTAGAPLRVGTEFLVAEYTAAPEAPPVALVAAVGGSLCGFAVVRIGGEAAIAAGITPVTLVVVEPAAVRADKASSAVVYVFAIDDKAAPRRGPAPAFRPTVGKVAGVEPLGPGAWRARWSLPAIEASTAAVEATFGREPPSSGSLELTPGPPAAIEIIRDPVNGGSGGTPAAVLINIRDSLGNLTEGHLEVESDVAKMGRTIRLERGIFRVSVLVPPGTKDESVVITARTDGAEAKATFSTASSAAAEVRVTPHGPIRADPSTRGQFEVLEVAVVDASGNPVNEPPVGSGGKGHFKDAFPVGPGRWALPYNPPLISEDTSEQVVVTAGPASTTVDLELVASHISLSVGAKAGLAMAGAGTGLSLGAEGGAWMPFGRARLGLVLDVNWWMASKTSSAMVGSAASTYEATQYYPSILLSGAWRRPYGDRWIFWATAGGGGSAVSNHARVAGQPGVNEIGFAPVVSGSISASPRRYGPGSPFLELRATWVGDPRLSTLSGSSTTFLGLVGYRFDVG